jgi:hypothetical protein
MANPAIRSHYSTAIGATGPRYYSPYEMMGSWFLQNYQGIVEPSNFACFGMVANLPHWPPYWAQVWGDVVMRKHEDYLSMNTARVDLLFACSKWKDGVPEDDYFSEGYRMIGETHFQSFDVSSSDWTTFQIPVQEILLGNPIRESDMSDGNYAIDWDDPTGYWWAPLVYWWYNQTYLPYLKVTAGAPIEVKCLRLWSQPLCGPGPLSYRLNVPGTVTRINTWMNESGATQGGGIWNDGSDSTYASFGWSSSYTAARGVFGTYTGGFISKLTLYFRASASGDNRTQPITAHLHRKGPGFEGIMRFFGGAYTGTSSVNYNVPVNFDIPNDGIERNYSVSIDAAMLEYSGWDSLDQLRDVLLAGGNFILFSADDFAGRNFGDPHAVGTIRIYEAWLVIESPLTGTR